MNDESASDENRLCTAFAGSRRLTAGKLAVVSRKVRSAMEQGAAPPILVFDDSTGEQIDIDFGPPSRAQKGGGPKMAVGGAKPKVLPRKSAGRPKLGVIAREVTLLPAHWDWLEAQPGGVSSSLRRLVHEARKRSP